MKIQFFLVCLPVLALSCSETKKTQGYTIGGEIKGVDSGMVRVTAYDNDTRTSSVIDSGSITAGKFRLQGKAAAAQKVSLTFGEGNYGLSFFLENSEITINADTTGAQHYDYTAYGMGKGARLTNFSVSGSTTENEWKSFTNNPRLKKFEPVMAELNKAHEQAASKDEAYRIKERYDSVSKLITIERKQLIDSFIAANPSSPTGAFIFHEYFQFNEQMPLAEMEAIMAAFKDEARSTVYYKSLVKSLDQKRSLQPGSLAPDFTLLKPDSTQFTLSSLRGKYVMLDFWASWCVPCRQAIPHWKEVYAKYQPKGFEILGVTNDSRWKDWFKALEEEKMPWPQVADEFPVKNMPARVASLYMTPYLPCYILLDKEGRIILHNPSKEEIDAKLKELLGA